MINRVDNSSILQNNIKPYQEVLKNEIFSLVIIIVSFIMMCFVTTLIGFHFYYICNGLTTYLYVKYSYFFTYYGNVFSLKSSCKNVFKIMKTKSLNFLNLVLFHDELFCSGKYDEKIILTEDDYSSTKHNKINESYNFQKINTLCEDSKKSDKNDKFDKNQNLNSLNKIDNKLYLFDSKMKALNNESDSILFEKKSEKVSDKII